MPPKPPKPVAGLKPRPDPVVPLLEQMHRELHAIAEQGKQNEATLRKQGEVQNAQGKVLAIIAAKLDTQNDPAIAQAVAELETSSDALAEAVAKNQPPV